LAHKLAEAAEIRLGLLLVHTLGYFFSHSGLNKQHTSYEWVEVNDAVLEYESIQEPWDRKLKEVFRRDEEAQAASKPARSKREILRTAQDDYELLKPLGEGGTGRVWLARNSAGSDVAIKILHPELATTEKRRRFQNEIRFSLNTEHPHIIRTFDHGTRP
jgi:serine/threonine protein kinase